MAMLGARPIELVPSPRGHQVDVMLVEPNGDQVQVRCLILGERTEIGGNEDEMKHLNQRYGPQAVCVAARTAALGFRG